MNEYKKDLGEMTIAPRGTGSFGTFGISHTPYVGFMITKLTANNSLNSITLHTTNFRDESPGVGYRGAPSGSANEYWWYNETGASVSPGGLASGVGGVSGSLFSGSVAAAPFTTGSAVGSAMFHANNLNSLYGRITLRSDSGGRFRLIVIGKPGS